MSGNVIITGCARSGTTLLLYLSKGLKNYNVFDLDEVPPDEYNKFCKYDIDKYSPFIIKNPQPRLKHFNITEYLKYNLKIICIYRDGRDVLVSRHPPEKVKYYVPIKRWINSIKDLLTNINNPNVFSLSYESLVDKPKIKMKEIANFLCTEFKYPTDFFNNVTKKMKSGFGFKGPRKVDKNSMNNWKKDEHLERINNIRNSEHINTFNEYQRKFGYGELK